MSMMSSIRRALKKSLYTDCEWLRCYEVEALVTFYQYLNKSEKNKLIHQFRRLDMLERSPSGKLIQFFDGLDTIRKNWPEEIKIEPGTPMAGYQFAIENNGEVDTRFVVFLGKGGLGEIQFTKTPVEYNNGTSKVVQIGKILSEEPELPEGKTFLFEKLISEEEEQQLAYDLNRDNSDK